MAHQGAYSHVLRYPQPSTSPGEAVGLEGGVVVASARQLIFCASVVEEEELQSQLNLSQSFTQREQAWVHPPPLYQI